MKYEIENQNINESLKILAREIINNSEEKKSFLQDTLDDFVINFIHDELKYGRIIARNNLIRELNKKYTR